jgi:hypothetical protein
MEILQMPTYRGEMHIKVVNMVKYKFYYLMMSNSVI